MNDGLYAFEHTYLDKLRLAAEVILELAAADAIPDTLEVELRGFKDQVEHALLLPGRPAQPVPAPPTADGTGAITP